MAEEEGFEPSESCPSAVFKTAALNHSTILPHLFVYIKYHIKQIFTTAWRKKNCYLVNAPAISSCTVFAKAAGSATGLPSKSNA